MHWTFEERTDIRLFGASEPQIRAEWNMGWACFFWFPGRGQARIQGDKGLAAEPFRQSTHYHGKNLRRPLLRVDEWMLCGFQNLPLWLRKTWSWYGFLVLCGFIPRRFLRAGGHCSIPKNSNFHGFTFWMRFHLKFAIDKDIQGYDWLERILYLSLKAKKCFCSPKVSNDHNAST